MGRRINRTTARDRCTVQKVSAAAAVVLKKRVKRSRVQATIFFGRVLCDSAVRVCVCVLAKISDQEDNSSNPLAVSALASVTWHYYTV